jgi:hypothetical protein
VVTAPDSTDRPGGPDRTKPTIRQFLKSRPDIVNRVVVLSVVLAIAAALVALFTVPVQTSFSAGFSIGCAAISSPPCPTFNFPVGAHVTGTFSTVGGTPVGLQVFGRNGPIVFSSNASSGSFSFTASNPPYAFAPDVGGNGTTSVSGHYTSPILVL